MDTKQSPPMIHGAEMHYREADYGGWITHSWALGAAGDAAGADGHRAQHQQCQYRGLQPTARRPHLAPAAVVWLLLRRQWRGRGRRQPDLRIFSDQAGVLL